jgi:hypothetical protein
MWALTRPQQQPHGSSNSSSHLGAQAATTLLASAPSWAAAVAAAPSWAPSTARTGAKHCLFMVTKHCPYIGRQALPVHGRQALPLQWASSTARAWAPSTARAWAPSTARAWTPSTARTGAKQPKQQSPPGPTLHLTEEVGRVLVTFPASSPGHRPQRALRSSSSPYVHFKISSPHGCYEAAAARMGAMKQQQPASVL